VGPVAASGFHVVNKPQDYGSLGHYRFAGVTGAIAAGMAANGEVFQFRWSDATRFALIQKVRVVGMRTTTAFAVGTIDLKMTRATAWSANGTGGTALTLTDPQLQLRPPLMGPTLAADIRIATTAALGAGTKTLDTQDMGFIVTHSSAGTGGATPIIGSTYLPITELFEQDTGDGEHPLVLSQNEGFVIRATVPATGVWNIGISIRWAELAAF
ncbi:MAG: hypothetical protein ACREYE_00480, partial [Gammaproteobacteria bacterium]